MLEGLSFRCSCLFIRALGVVDPSERLSSIVKNQEQIISAAIGLSIQSPRLVIADISRVARFHRSTYMQYSSISPNRLRPHLLHDVQDNRNQTCHSRNDLLPPMLPTSIQSGHRLLRALHRNGCRRSCAVHLNLAPLTARPSQTPGVNSRTGLTSIS